MDANCLLVKVNTDTCIICIYRPHGYKDSSNFVHSIDSLLKTLSTYKNILLCGDINIDILPNTSDKRSYDYLNVLASHGILPGHSFPTHNKTCLDHAMVKSSQEAICLVLETSITDHDCVAVGLHHGTRLEYTNKQINRIDYQHLDFEMKGLNLQPVLDCSDANTATDLLVDLLTSAIKKCTKPIATSKRKRISKPWITIGLLRCMRNRDNLHKKVKKDPDNEVLKTTYRRYKNFCNNLLKKVKRNYEKEEIKAAGSNSKKLWDSIKKITGSLNKKDRSPELISSHNPKESINKVNDFFANIGKKLAGITSQTQLTNKVEHDEDTSTSPAFSLILFPTNEDEVLSLIDDLKENCAVGIDGIPGKVVKRYKHLLTIPLTHICNLAISTGVFPRAFKTALIKPIHKSGDGDCVNNYRPISVLPSISKILEKIINKRLKHFLESNNLLSAQQFGFRQGKSTSDAVLELTNAIANDLDNKRKCLTIFLDLAKAFDTVSVPKLMSKMERIGIRGLPLKLLGDYLGDRKQRVKIDNWCSQETPVNFGVPQGSVLSPTLFLIYINELTNLRIPGCKIFSFADDTALYFSGQDWMEVFALAQSGFCKVNNWLLRNTLTLNVTKTKYIPFALKANYLPPPALNIIAHTCETGSVSCSRSCSCPTIQATDNIKYLGVTLDHSLSFKQHTECLVPRLRKLIFIFRKLRHVAHRQVIRMVFHALCQSIVQYCIVCWGGAAKTHLIEVERAQRAILKVAAGLPFRYPTVDLYKEWDVLTVRQSFILQTVLKIHSTLTYQPCSLEGKRRIGRVCPSLRYHTSRSHHLFGFLGPYLYNKLNTTLKIYPLLRYHCKHLVTAFLKTLGYEETENLLTSNY